MKKGYAKLQQEGKTVEFEYEPNMSSFYYNACKILNEDIAIPNQINVDSPNGGFLLKVGVRGSYIENGVEKPSMFVQMSGKNVFGLIHSAFPEKYLVCIHPESNNYKGYHLRPMANGTIDCIYGSIDVMAKGQGRHVKEPYDASLFWVRYFEKLSKGYVDKSDVYLDTAKPQKKVSTNSKVVDNADTRLYAKLLKFTKQVVNRHLANLKITKKQVKESRKIWNTLGKYKTVKAFNKHLMELMLISPRKRDPLSDNISRYLATDTSDFGRIIDFEESLINAMESNIGEDDVCSDAFKNFGIDVFEATAEQKAEVMNMLGNSPLKNKVLHVWRIKPLKQEKLFAEYCKKNHVKTIKKFWHGSRSENWISIIQHSLMLNPNAQITGKMFGKGIYFAPSPSKSFGYTSCYGTYWANGRNSTGFMGIYATAYGNPFEPTTWGSICEHQVVNSNGKYNCLHAHAGSSGLRNDEVVFYNEHAVCLNYLVEFTA